MTNKEDTEFEDFIKFIDEAHTLLENKLAIREEKWDEFLELIDEGKNSADIWTSLDFQKKVKTLCHAIDCRLLGEENWEDTEELELLAQISLRTPSQEDSYEEDLNPNLEDSLDASPEELEEDFDMDLGSDDDETEDFGWPAELFDVPLESFITIAPKDVLGLFILLDRYIEFYAAFLKRAEYELMSDNLPKNKDGTEITSEIQTQ